MPGSVSNLGTLSIALRVRGEGARTELEKTALSVRQADRAYKGLQRAGYSLNRSIERVHRRVFSLNGALAILSGATGVGLIIREFNRMADQMTLAESRVRLVTGSVTELRSAQSALFEVAQRTRSSYFITTDLYARVARSTENLNISQARLLRVTEAINKAALVGGATNTEYTAGIIQLTQGFASGALHGDELRSVLEQLPRLAEAIARGLRVDRGQLRELGELRILSADKVFRAIESQIAAINHDFAFINRTIEQSIQQVRNTAARAVQRSNEDSIITNQFIAQIDRIRYFLSQPQVQENFISGVVTLMRVGVTVAENFRSSLLGVGTYLGIRFAARIYSAVSGIRALLLTTTSLSAAFTALAKGPAVTVIAIATSLAVAVFHAKVFNKSIETVAERLDKLKERAFVKGDVSATLANLREEAERLNKSLLELRPRVSLEWQVQPTDDVVGDLIGGWTDIGQIRRLQEEEIGNLIGHRANLAAVLNDLTGGWTDIDQIRRLQDEEIRNIIGSSANMATVLKEQNMALEEESESRIAILNRFFSLSGLSLGLPNPGEHIADAHRARQEARKQQQYAQTIELLGVINQEMAELANATTTKASATSLNILADLNKATTIPKVLADFGRQQLQAASLALRQQQDRVALIGVEGEVLDRLIAKQKVDFTIEQKILQLVHDRTRAEQDLENRRELQRKAGLTATRTLREEQGRINEDLQRAIEIPDNQADVDRLIEKLAGVKVQIEDALAKTGRSSATTVRAGVTALNDIKEKLSRAREFRASVSKDVLIEIWAQTNAGKRLVELKEEERKQSEATADAAVKAAAADRKASEERIERIRESTREARHGLAVQLAQERAQQAIALVRLSGEVVGPVEQARLEYLVQILDVERDIKQIREALIQATSSAQANNLLFEQAALESKRKGFETEISRLAEILSTRERTAEIERVTADDIKARNDEIKARQQEQIRLARYLSRSLSKGFADAILKARTLADVMRSIVAGLAEGLSRHFLNAILGGLSGVDSRLSRINIPAVPDSAFQAASSSALGSRHRGGPVVGGRRYRVTEREPELLIPQGSGNVLPFSKLMAGVSGRGGDTINVYNEYHIDSTDGPGVRRALAEAKDGLVAESVERTRTIIARDIRRPSPLRV